MDKNVEKIKSSRQIVEKVLGSEVNLSHRNRTKYDLDKKRFENVILNLEQIELRSNLLQNEFEIDLSKYETIYYTIIDNLFELLYPKEAIQLIKFYLYGRISNEGEAVYLKDNKGNDIVLENITQLYNLVQNLLKQNV